MKVKYRYLEGISLSDQSKNVFGLAFFEPFDSINDMSSRFINARMERTYSLPNSISLLSEKDIPSYINAGKLQWSPLLEVDIPTELEEDWIPHDLLIERLEYWNQINRNKDQQVA